MFQQTMKAFINPDNPDKQTTFLDTPTIDDKYIFYFLHLNKAISTKVLFEAGYLLTKNLLF